MEVRISFKLDTLERVDWLNNRRLPEPIGNIRPAESKEKTSP